MRRFLCHPRGAIVDTTDLTRRTFIKLTAATGALSMVGGCVQMNMPGGSMVYIRSGRGIAGISNAAKKNNANKVFLTEAAALANPAHPGDKSVVKMTYISNAMFAKLFPNGNDVADFRKI